MVRMIVIKGTVAYSKLIRFVPLASEVKSIRELLEETRALEECLCRCDMHG